MPHSYSDPAQGSREKLNETNGPGQNEQIDSSTLSMLDAALEYAEKGLQVFPAVLGQKKSHKAAKYSNGRRWGATINEKTIRHDFTKWPTANIGIPTGSTNRFFVVETDTLEGHNVDGAASLQELENEYGKLPETRQSISPTGSVHRLFKYPVDEIIIKNSTSQLGPGIDVLGEGGMVLAPPSVKSETDSRTYRWLNHRTIAAAPEWLIELCKVDETPRTASGEPGEVELGKITAALAVIPNNDLHFDDWNRIGLAIYQATDGSENGFEAFDQWSRKSNRYDCNKKAPTTYERWHVNYVSCPPSRTGAHNIFYLANLETPGWQRTYEEEVLQAVFDNISIEAASDQQKEEEEPKAERSVDQDQQKNPPPKTPRIITATPYQWIDPSKVPMREWLYRPNYIRQFVSLTIATGGVGKSSLLIAEALAMVSGEALLGIQPDEQLRVWYWNGEDPIDELQRRFVAAIKYYKLSKDDIGDRLFIDSGDVMPIVLAEEDKDGIRVAVPVAKQVVQTLLENKIDVLMIDPFVSCHHVNENDNNAIDRVAKTWSKIAKKANCANMLAHHSRKVVNGNGSVSVDDGRGASALLAAVRSGRALNPMTTAEAEKIVGFNKYDRRSYFKVDSDVGKANLHKPADAAEWYQLVSVNLENNSFGGIGGDEVGVVTTWEYPAPSKLIITDEQIRRAQDAIAAGGPFRSNRQSKNQPWVGLPIAEALGFELGDDAAGRANKTQVERIIREWLAEGYLKTAQVKQPDGSYKTRPFIEVGTRP